MVDWSQQMTRLEARRAELTDELVGIEDRLDDEPSKDWGDRATERQGDEVLESMGRIEEAARVGGHPLERAHAQLVVLGRSMEEAADEPVAARVLGVPPEHHRRRTRTERE